MSNQQNDINKIYKRGNAAVPPNCDNEQLTVNAGDPSAVWTQKGSQIIKKEIQK